VLFGTRLAEAPASEAAADGKRQRAPFTGEERGQSNEAADEYGPAIKPARSAPSSIRSAAS
jgi:hypothetical protein